MNGIRSKVMQHWIDMKARNVARRIGGSLQFPIGAEGIKKVMVILPRNLDLLDRASSFVQSLRKTYPGWRIELFDVDKLNKSDLNSMRLPRPQILNKLRAANYHFVLDLNDSNDILSAYITLMTEAPYRLHMQSESSFYYNIVYQAPRLEGESYYEPLLAYLRNLFVRN